MNNQTAQNGKEMIGFILRESGVLRSPAFLYVVAASGSRTGLIFLINETAERGGATWGLFLALLGTAALMLASMHLARMSGVHLVQGLARRMRAENAGRLLRADVSFFQNRDIGTIYHNATMHTDLVAGMTLRLIDVAQAVLLFGFVLVYMSMQMPAAVIAAVIALGVGIAAFLLNEAPATRAVRATHLAHGRYHGSLQDLMHGYKELRLRRARRRALDAQIESQIDEVRGMTVVSERHYSFGNITANGALAAMLISVVVLLPIIADADSVTMLQILTLVLFSFGPIDTMIGGLPQIARSSVSWRMYKELTTSLEGNAELPDPAAEDRHNSFETIELRGATVHLTRDVGEGSDATDSFTLGPIDLTLVPGQSVFITGGNGMGKSTLLSLLTGLRHPDAGEILIDGVPVTRENVSDYRSVFSAVFSEFYLFRALYGMSTEERARLTDHMAEMGLADVVSLEAGGFANLALSTGQKRRLALSIALAEARPVLVLDEFAADQDPGRRRFFYDELVPRLAKAGHCVVAVTHDDHMFDKADRLIRMADGKIVSDTLNRRSQE